MEIVLVWLKKNLKGDAITWAIGILLSLFSILIVYSAVSSAAIHQHRETEYFLVKHSALILLSLFVMWLAHNISYVYYSRVSRFLLIISVPLLIYTYFFGISINGATRWVSIPFVGLSFQPSDLAKLALIVNLTSMLAKRQGAINDAKVTLTPILIWCGIICFCIALSDVGSAILLFVTSLIIMFIGRVPMKQLSILVVVGIMALSCALYLGSRWPTVQKRLTTWWEIQNGDITAKNADAAFQSIQSNIAISKGGFWGVGVGESQQRNILPEAFSDYIFAIINEEYGSKVSILIILAYLTILYRGMIIATNSDKAFGGLLAIGLSFSLVLQAMVNMGVVVGLGPITGLTLPLLSMGGTSLLFTGLTLGIILSVSRGDMEEEVQRD